MRSKFEIARKRKKLRSRFLHALIKQSNQKKKENCKYWFNDVPGDCRCAYPKLNNSGSYRECPLAESCQDFENKWKPEDIQERFLRLIDDENYLAKNYRDLFILNWMLQDSLLGKIEKLITSLKTKFYKKVK